MKRLSVDGRLTLLTTATAAAAVALACLLFLWLGVDSWRGGALVLGGATLFALAVAYLVQKAVLGRVLRPLRGQGREDELRAEIARQDSELVAARQAVERADRTKSAFLANMSHELRTPLNAIIGYSEMLQEEAADGGRAESIPDLKKIHGAGKHLLALINDILDLSKIESGSLELSPETFEVSALVDDVRSVAQPLADKNGNVVEVDCAPDVGAMVADRKRVRQILLSLLTNATKFTERGRVRLEARREAAGEGDVIVFRVSDTGIGMDEEQASRLFQAFSQGDDSTSRKHGGPGLGLVMSRRFAQMMGGDVTATSRPGQGSVFTVRLPAGVGRPAPVAGLEWRAS